MPRKKFKLYKKRKPRQLVMKDRVDGLPAPNHMAYAGNYRLTDDLLSNRRSDGTPIFKMLELMVPTSEGAGSPGGLAFVDERYGLRDWSDYVSFMDFCKKCHGINLLAALQKPPTWMDPEIFVRMVAAHPRAKKLTRMYVKKGSSGKRIKMNKLLQQVFDEEYLVYALTQFAKVRDLLAQWVIAHYAEEISNEPRKRKRRCGESS